MAMGGVNHVQDREADPLDLARLNMDSPATGVVW